MIIYHYNPQTGLLTGSGSADIDPQESRLQKKDCYAIPAHATSESPPVAEAGQLVRWVNGAWVVEDLPPEVIPSDTKQLEKLQQIKHDEIYRNYVSACSGSVGCEASGTLYLMNAGEDHASRMFGGYNLAKGFFDLGQGPETMTVTDYNDDDHSDVPLADAYQIALQQGAHFATQRQKKNDLRRQIEAVEIPSGGTLADGQALLDGITW